jgi:hypothetical protein
MLKCITFRVCIPILDFIYITEDWNITKLFDIETADLWQLKKKKKRFFMNFEMMTNINNVPSTRTLDGAFAHWLQERDLSTNLNPPEREGSSVNLGTGQALGPRMATTNRCTYPHLILGWILIFKLKSVLHYCTIIKPLEKNVSWTNKSLCTAVSWIHLYIASRGVCIPAPVPSQTIEVISLAPLVSMVVWNLGKESTALLEPNCFNLSEWWCGYLPTSARVWLDMVVQSHLYWSENRGLHGMWQVMKYRFKPL